MYCMLFLHIPLSCLSPRSTITVPDPLKVSFILGAGGGGGAAAAAATSRRDKETRETISAPEEGWNGTMCTN